MLAIAIQSLGYDAISFTGYQAGIRTKGIHSKSEIESIDIDRIKENLEQGKIVIVAGFQGINESGDITTLGRGGSDTSAVALAAALKCECRIYTDVEGIYSVDPRIYKNAKLLDKISYEEMMEMAHLGAGVMETRAVELGKKFNIPIFVGRSLSEAGGTYIMERDSALEEKLVTGLSVANEIIVTTISNIEYSSKKIADIFSTINSCGLNINMITQNINRNRKTDISFSCTLGEKYLLDQVVKQIKSKYPEIEIEYEGIGMINNSGIAGRFFSALSNAGVEFYQVTTSEISISCSVDRNLINRAVESAAIEFGL